MSNKRYAKTDRSEPIVYQIRIEGHLGRQWKEWFEGLTVTLEENGDTVLTGPVVDQAALHGLLRKVRDLGMPLLAVNGRKPDQADASVGGQQMAASCLDKSLVIETHQTHSKKE